MPFHFYAFALLGDTGNCIREAHLIPVTPTRRYELDSLLDHGWKVIEHDHVSNMLAEHNLEINPRLTRLFGYPVASRRS